MMVVIKLIWW